MNDDKKAPLKKEAAAPEKDGRRNTALDSLDVTRTIEQNQRLIKPPKGYVFAPKATVELMRGYINDCMAVGVPVGAKVELLNDKTPLGYSCVMIELEHANMRLFPMIEWTPLVADNARTLLTMTNRIYDAVGPVSRVIDVMSERFGIRPSIYDLVDAAVKLRKIVNKVNEHAYEIAERISSPNHWLNPIPDDADMFCIMPAAFLEGDAR
jgi:hypothetical protein